jgi:hypothetical protein
LAGTIQIVCETVESAKCEKAEFGFYSIYVLSKYRSYADVKPHLRHNSTSAVKE